MGDFKLLTRGDQLPVFAFTTADQITSYDVFDISRRMRETGSGEAVAAHHPHRGEVLPVAREGVRGHQPGGPRGTVARHKGSPGIQLR